MNRGGERAAVKVWYVEGRGAAALAELSRLGRALRENSDCTDAELQVSPAQPELTLLVSWWQTGPPQLSLPAQAKSWVFEVLPPDEGF